MAYTYPMNVPWQQQAFLGGFGQSQPGTPYQFLSTSSEPVSSETRMTGSNLNGRMQMHPATQATNTLIPRPVGELPIDEDVLVNALNAAQKEGSSFYMALNHLHAVKPSILFT